MPKVDGNGKTQKKWLVVSELLFLFFLHEGENCLNCEMSVVSGLKI